MVIKRSNEEKYNNACCLYGQYQATGNVEFLRQGLFDINDVVESTVANNQAIELKREMKRAFTQIIGKKK